MTGADKVQRIEVYASKKGLTVGRRLGFGVHGSVSTRRAKAERSPQSKPMNVRRVIGGRCVWIDGISVSRNTKTANLAAAVCGSRDGVREVEFRKDRPPRLSNAKSSL